MYIAARGGEHAIEQAERLFHALKAPLSPALIAQVDAALPYLVDRVMGEASLYSPQLAALAIAQTGGELYEAVMLLRAFRSTQPRIAYAETVTPEAQLVVRRISAAFKDIPGGQVLGPTLDYSHRLLKTEALREPLRSDSVEAADQPAESRYPAVADWQRAQGQIDALAGAPAPEPAAVPDLTRGPLQIPAGRAMRLQALARADTGGVLALGYANMRGYGAIHPTVNELRLGFAEVRLKHPLTGAVFSAGRVRVSQAEVVNTTMRDGGQALDLGFCATLGWNEVKTIAGSMLDRAMDLEEPHPAHTEDFVLHHTEPVESSGFCIHFKLPHYITFSSAVEALRSAALAMGWIKEPDDKKAKAEETR